jgi:hypothetical protein
MKSGDLIEFGSSSYIGRAIKWFTKKDVNHSAFVFRIDSFVGLKDRVFVIEALGDGLEINALSSRIKEYDGMVYWLKLKDTYDSFRDPMSSFAFMMEARGVEKRYDYVSLFANMFGKVSMDAKKFFCSEFYHAAMVYAGLTTGGKALRPGEFESLGFHEDRCIVGENLT